MTADAPAYRTHLFTDLRGYTSYLERAGNAAGAELLERYRRLVRDAIARLGGTEVSTEGDAFYVVFPSASSAVMGGLAIVDDIDRENAANPDRPIHVGVGIHSGEVVETSETFVGTAVNVASRVCAVARPGEVLVTATVRGLVHGSVDATFVSRGRKKLKGLTEPVEVFAVVPVGKAAPTQRNLPQRRTAFAAVAGVGVLVVGLMAGFALLPRQPAATATPGPTQVPAAVVGPLGIGTYQSAKLAPKIRFEVTDLGWSVYRDTSDATGLLYQFKPSGQLDIGRPGRVFVDPCSSGGASVPTGRTPAEFFAAAAQAPYLNVPEPTAVSVGGRSGLRSDILVDPGAMAACGSLGGSGVAVFSLGGEFWAAQPGEVARVIALDTEDGLITLLVSNAEASATSVNALEDFFNLADRIIESISF
jgi:class 3 adenylate cyclase